MRSGRARFSRRRARRGASKGSRTSRTWTGSSLASSAPSDAARGRGDAVRPLRADLAAVEAGGAGAAGFAASPSSPASGSVGNERKPMSKQAYAAALRDQMDDRSKGPSSPRNRDPSPIFGEPSRRDAFGNERAAVDKQSYAAQLREQMAQDAGRRDAERARRLSAASLL